MNMLHSTPYCLIMHPSLLKGESARDALPTIPQFSAINFAQL